MEVSFFADVLDQGTDGVFVRVQPFDHQHMMIRIHADRGGIIAETQLRRGAVGVPVQRIDADGGSAGDKGEDGFGIGHGVEGDRHAQIVLARGCPDMRMGQVFLGHAVADDIGRDHAGILFIGQMLEQCQREHGSLAEPGQDKAAAVVVMRHVVVERLADLVFHILELGLEFRFGQKDGVDGELMIIGRVEVEGIAEYPSVNVAVFLVHGDPFPGAQRGMVDLLTIGIMRGGHIGGKDVENIDLILADGLAGLIPPVRGIPLRSRTAGTDWTRAGHPASGQDDCRGENGNEKERKFFHITYSSSSFLIAARVFPL